MIDAMTETEIMTETSDDFDAFDTGIDLDGVDEKGRLWHVDQEGRFRPFETKEILKGFIKEHWLDGLDEQARVTTVGGPQRQAMDPRADVPRDREFVKLSRRVCLIQRHDGTESTGFLVGPDLMLTAAHALMGTEGVFANPDEVTILFDQFVWNEKTGTRAHGDVCGLRRIPFTKQPDVVASSILIDAKSRTVIDDNELDYVLVRLDRPIGLMFLPYSHRIRGWNNCRIGEIEPPESPEKVFVVQHPLGKLQQFAAGEVYPQQPSQQPQSGFGKFFKYKTSTLNGSSGAPIVDEKRRVVGIHVGERSINKQIGVSFSQISKDLKEKKVQLPGFLLKKALMDHIFGFSETEKARKPKGQDWRGDRLFDQILFDHDPDPEDLRFAS